MKTSSDPQARRLLERVVGTGNMKRAWKQVKQKGGGKGIDGRTIADTEAFLKTQWPGIRQTILDENFHPKPVKHVRSDSLIKGLIQFLGGGYSTFRYEQAVANS